MNLRAFLKLVEIQTKIASVIPFLLGTGFTFYYFDEFNIVNAVILFLAMIVFDMTATAINNYMDYKNDINKQGYGYEEHNAIVKEGLKLRLVKGLIVSMLILAIFLGLLLVYYTDYIVLFIGVICFGVGILYSFGPIPISRTPLGEIFSGITMGFGITFLAVYIHIFDKNVLSISLLDSVFMISIDFESVIPILLISIPIICGIANIMLCNNICDMEEDIINQRYTLPTYIGKEKSLSLFEATYYIAFSSIILSVIIKVLPWISLLSLVSVIPIINGVKEFRKIQSKKDTFIISIKNLIVLSGFYLITIYIAVLLK